MCYISFTEIGATQTMKTNQKVELKQHFEILPMKCALQNNEISNSSLTGDIYAITVLVKSQAQTSSTFTCLRP